MSDQLTLGRVDAPRLLVTSVTVRNVLGAAELNMEPGRITTLSGYNASGKSTALAAVQAALGGGNLAKLKRVGAGDDEPAEVVLVLEGGGKLYRIEKRDNKTVRVRAQVGDSAALEDVPRPQEWLNALFDPRGCNPVSFLNAKADERAVLLLEALPLTLDRQELAAIIGEHASLLPAGGLPPGIHPLLEVDLVHDAIYRARTGVQVDAKGKASAADQTKRNMPAKLPADCADKISELEGEASRLAVLAARLEEQANADLAAVRAKQAANVSELETALNGDFQTRAAKLRAQHAEHAAERRAELEKALADRLALVQVEIDRLSETNTANLETAEGLAAAAVLEAEGACKGKLAEAEQHKHKLATTRETLASLRAQADAAIKAKALHEQARKFEEQAEALTAKGKQMTATLDALAAFKRRMAEALPIEGLAIAGKEITVRGVPFDQLNQAQRVDVAVRVACVRAKSARLPVLFVDGAEALDPNAFAAFVERVSREPVQLFVARVEGHALEVKSTDGGPA